VDLTGGPQSSLRRSICAQRLHPEKRGEGLKSLGGWARCGKVLAVKKGANFY